MTRRAGLLIVTASVALLGCTRPSATGPPTTAGAVVTPITPSATSGQPSAPTTPATTAAAHVAPTTTSLPTAAPSSVLATVPPTTALARPPTVSAQPDEAACLAGLPLPWRAAQVLMPAVYGDQLESARVLIDELDIGNAILMTWPEGASQDALHALKATNVVPLSIATDEEGGDVQRLRRLGQFAAAAEVRASMSPDDAYVMIADHAFAVAALGIDVVFGPVVDVAEPGGDGPIGDRAFSDDPMVVSDYARAYVDAWRTAGVLPVLKHFPGHGRASADSHYGRSGTPPVEQLAEVDLVPYNELAGFGAGVMVGHLDVPGLTDGNLPASLSPQAIGYLRNGLRYQDALVFTDALNMDAIGSTWTEAEAAVLALVAGADVPLYANLEGSRAIVDAITAAVANGSLSEARLNDALGRVLATKDLTPCTALALAESDA